MTDVDEPDYRPDSASTEPQYGRASLETFKLDTLNDYCLLNIIKFLDLKSKLKLHMTNKKLNNLISGWLSNQKFFGDPNYSLVELCTNKSHHLNDYQYSLRPLTEYRSNSGWNGNIMALNRLFQLAGNLECLHFNCLDDENSVNERLVISILSLSRITCLSFGVGLQVSPKNWNSIVSQFGNQLQHLQINRVNYLTLENIIKHCPNLISLHIRFCPSSIDCLSYLWPKLRRLRIQSMATIYLRNALFTDRYRQVNVFDDEETVDLTLDEIHENQGVNHPAGEQLIIRNNANNPVSNPTRNPTGNPTGNPTNTVERHLSRMDNVWYWNLVELRLNKVTVRSLTVLFNHCINLRVLDVVLFFNRGSIVFENQDFIQLAYRMRCMRLFALDVHSKWLTVKLDQGLASTLNEWSRIEVLVIKRGLITEELFNRIKQNCRHLKVISVEFYDCIPYNHRLNEITDRVVDSLVELSELVKLRLHFTGLTDVGVTRLVENCTNLKYLDLFGCLQITSKSLKAIFNRLNWTNRCNAIFLNKNAANKSVGNNPKFESKFESKFGSEVCKSKNKKESIKSTDSLDQQSLDSFDAYSAYSCSQFNTITANCIECGKTPATFYVSINRTKIDLKKDQIQPPNTLFILSEDDPEWNCHNYPNTH